MNIPTIDIMTKRWLWPLPSAAIHLQATYTISGGRERKRERGKTDSRSTTGS
jgi:hypothetical protein